MWGKFVCFGRFHFWLPSDVLFHYDSYAPVLAMFFIRLFSFLTYLPTLMTSLFMSGMDNVYVPVLAMFFYSCISIPYLFTYFNDTPLLLGHGVES